MKIMLAEDTADLNKVICAVLNHEGYDVDPAFDGEEAMERINTEGYDCLRTVIHVHGFAELCAE